MIDIVLAGVLGAALLAVVLLFQGYRRNRALITQLQAELAAQRAALSGPRYAAADPGSDGRPGKQRRHRISFRRCRLAARALIHGVGRVRRVAAPRHPGPAETGTPKRSAARTTIPPASKTSEPATDEQTTESADSSSQVAHQRFLTVVE
ncbi:hypothetical protein AQJ11_02720 [Streptomyces corchorusii]|uniref:Uncharacterized protein n=2 Tax=Streptomyces TaxID=1883 RepID=A0A124HPJ9_STRCK|nr:hypothetical protein [Streptomyces corchorusii]KUN32457.1 hypothetical protein AQJ11_02720 [Streptomyces corchorusii]